MHIFSIALDFFLSKKNNNRKTVLCIVLGIALSISALLVILAAVDNLQNSQLNVIRDLESFDLIISNPTYSPSEYMNAGTGNAFVFSDHDVLICNPDNAGSTVCQLRCINKNVYSESKNVFFRGNEDGLYLSPQMLYSLGSDVGDSVQITFLKKGKTNIVTPVNRIYRIAGIFSSGLSSFANKVIFSTGDIDVLKEFGNYNVGIYCDDVDSEKNNIINLDCNCIVKSWKEINGSLYSALVFEKTAVSCFLMLVCVIVCLNLKSAMLRITNAKCFDAGILRVLGYTRRQTSAVFFLYGLFITFFGELLGIIISFFLIKNINSIFSFMDLFFNLFGKSLYLSSFTFSLDILPSRFVYVCLAVTFFAFLFICAGAKKILQKDVMEVIVNASY